MQNCFQLKTVVEACCFKTPSNAVSSEVSVSLQLLFVQAGIVCPASKQADVEEDVFHRRLSAGVEPSSTCISQVDRSLVEHSVRYSQLEVVPKRTAVVLRDEGSNGRPLSVRSTCASPALAPPTSCKRRTRLSCTRLSLQSPLQLRVRGRVPLPVVAARGGLSH